MFYIGKIKIYNVNEHPFEKNVMFEHGNLPTIKEKLTSLISELFFPEIEARSISDDLDVIYFGSNQAKIEILEIELINEYEFKMNKNRLMVLQ